MQAALWWGIPPEGGCRADADDLLASLNRRRARKGKPPLTAEQAKENDAAFRDGRPCPHD